jgi:NAD(P)-dependent dehydrogenase (short-subunit alcohol dehydrogenase family)
MGRLDDKVALVTGAASGIGEATALLFAAEGARVMLADIQDEQGHTVRDRIRAAADAFGRLDVLFNNAGLARGGSILDLTEEDWDLVLDVDLKSVYLGCKLAIPEMRKTGGGAIVNTASVAGLRGGARLHAYHAAKAGVINLTRSVAAEAAQYGVRVNCVCPGIIVTPIWRQIGVASDEAARAFWGMMGQRVLMGRVGTPEEVAKTVLFLASDDAAYVTGHALVVDGGLTAADPPRG